MIANSRLQGSIEDYSVCEPLKRLLEVLLPEVFFGSMAARGAEQEGRNPAQGSRGFGAPERPRNSTPRFSNSESRKPKAFQRPRRGVSVFKGAKKVGHSEAPQRPLRGPVSPDGPGRGSNPRAPTLGPQITGMSLSHRHSTAVPPHHHKKGMMRWRHLRERERERALVGLSMRGEKSGWQQAISLANHLLVPC